MGTAGGRPYLARNALSFAVSRTGSKLTTSRKPRAGSVAAAGKVYETALASFQPPRFTAAFVSAYNSMNSSSVLLMTFVGVMMSDGWYMISLITTGPTLG